ncbi:MAG: ribose 5-phosphate isomerase A [Candidatus Nanopelagicales bacterium]
MHWEGQATPKWPTEISNLDSKREIARQLADRAADGQVIGIGSGSTSFLALLALAERVHSQGLSVTCVPTSIEIESYCAALGLPVTTLLASRPDWCFDGADEVDPDHNMIKGRGGAFVREQFVFAAASSRVILVDQSKFVSRLGVNHAVPLAVAPEAANMVRSSLLDSLGVEPSVRPAGGKDGGVINESGSLVMDLPVDGSKNPVELERILLGTVGISATGLFVGYEFEIIG